MPCVYVHIYVCVCVCFSSEINNFSIVCGAIGVSVRILVIVVGMFSDWYIHERADMSVSV